MKKIISFLSLFLLSLTCFAGSGDLGGGGVGGSGDASGVAYWQDSTNISSDPNFYFDPSSDSLNLFGKIFSQEYLSVSPTDPTDAISTAGSSGTFTEVTVSTVTSSIDPSITNLAYRRIYDNGHAAPGKLIPAILFAGFGNNGVASFTDAQAERMATSVDPVTGRSLLMLKVQTRGRGNLGTIDYARDGQDVLDLLDHAVNAVGVNAYGYGTTGGASAIVIGYSTGALDALLFASRFPDRCLGVVLYFPNYDLGHDSFDSYYMLQGSANRATIASWYQPGGDLRLTPGAANLDQYVARNAVDAISRIVALPEGPHIWLLGDSDETEGITSITRLKNILQSIPAAAGKTHVHITQTGDSNRILHADGVNGASEQYAERYWIPYLLRNAAEWTMPRKSPASGFRILGWMKTKLWEIWLGPNTAPKTAIGAGGKDSAAELQYDDYSRRYRVKLITEANSNVYVEVLRDADKRNVLFTPKLDSIIDLNVIQSISSVADVGFQFSWRADNGVTDSSGVTNWQEALGGILAFTASANKPSYTTDGDGKNLIRFSAASSQKLLYNALIIDPTQDFTGCATVNKTNSTLGIIYELSNHGDLSRTGLLYTSGTDGGYAQNSTNGTMLANVNGVGGHTFSQNAKHVLCMMRKSSVLWESLDGSPWSYTAYIAGTYTTSGTNTTSIGAGWANGGGAYWQFLTGDIYEVDFKQSATSEADIHAYNYLMRSRWAF